MKLQNTLIPSALIALASAASGQSFSYPDFSSVAGLAMNGSAGQFGTSLRLTNTLGSLAGSSYYDTPVPVSAGFDTTFTFVIDTAGSSGADGMAFVIQNDPRGLTALGDSGTPLGYAKYSTSGAGIAIANSLVIEFDTWNSGSNGDTSDNEISIHTNGTGENDHDESFSLGRISPTTNMSNGLPHTCRILYEVGQLSVFLNDLDNPLLSVTYDFNIGGTHTNGNTVGGLSLIGGAQAYVGFSAATGGVTENHDVLSWEFGPSGVGTRYCVSAVNSTGGAAMIDAAGSSSIGANDLMLSVSAIPDQPGVFIYGRNLFIRGPSSNGVLLPVVTSRK